MALVAKVPCPECGSRSSFIMDTRRYQDYNKNSDDGDKIKRKRECDECDSRFYTVEFELEQYLEMQQKLKKQEEILQRICNYYNEQKDS